MCKVTNLREVGNTVLGQSTWLCDMQQRDISLELKGSLDPLELRLCHKNVTESHGEDIENIVKREVEVMNKVHAEGRGMKMGYRVGTG